MCFIKHHLIAKINSNISNKGNILKHDGFYYLDEPVKSTNKKINRFNRYNPYTSEEIAPSNWYFVSGKVLLEIHKMIKENKFYIYKKINGKDHKMRIKNDIR